MKMERREGRGREEKGREGRGWEGRGEEKGREGMPPNGNSWIRACLPEADTTCSVGPYALTCNANIYPHFVPRDFAHPIAAPVP